MSAEFKEELMDALLSSPYTKRISPIQLVTRCIICDDSKKHSNSAHMYIKVNIENNEPVLFNCFICYNGGVLTPQHLKEFNIRDLDLASKLMAYNKAAMKNMPSQLRVKDNNINVKIPIYRNISDALLRKKDYINGRLGLDLSFDDLYYHKVIFNIGDFLKINELKFRGKDDFATLLHENYVGFLSCRKEFIIFRNIFDDKNARYHKYSIFESLSNTRQFYTVPNSIDIMTPEPIHINITEGIFDILGVLYNVRENEKVNNIYTANCGSGYSNVLKYFIKLGLFGDNVIVNMYCDNDKDDDFYRRIMSNIKPFVGKINLFMNGRHKDFGVPKNKIEVIKKNLKEK